MGAGHGAIHVNVCPVLHREPALLGRGLRYGEEAWRPYSRCRAHPVQGSCPFPSAPNPSSTPLSHNHLHRCLCTHHHDFLLRILLGMLCCPRNCTAPHTLSSTSVSNTTNLRSRHSGWGHGWCDFWKCSAQGQQQGPGGSPLVVTLLVSAFLLA